MNEYNELKNVLTELKNNWDNNKNNLHQLDANWVCVKFPRKDWRLAKEIGVEKDDYWGWILWSGAVNENGTNFFNEIFDIVSNSNLNLFVSERQL